MSPGCSDEPPYLESRIMGKKSRVLLDEKVDGEYGLVINGHSLVRHSCAHTQIGYVNDDQGIGNECHDKVTGL